MKILVVDDERPARERLIHMLSSMKDAEPVGEAANGLEAVQLVQTARPDIVLMDIRMPGMDGLEASRHLAQMEEPPAIIFTTAYSDCSSRSWRMGLTRYPTACASNASSRVPTFAISAASPFENNDCSSGIPG